jgi:hypothetical protein
MDTVSLNKILSGDLSIIIQIVVAIVIVVFIVKVFFSKKSGGKTITEIDPKLEQISKKLLLDHLESMKKGELVSDKNIAAELLPALREKMAEFKMIIESGVKVESEVKNLDQAKISAIKKNDNTIEVKISALFRHEYLHNGKLIENPSDPESYVPENQQSHFDSNYYILNFKIIGDSDYELIGISDNIMGNACGVL